MSENKNIKLYDMDSIKDLRELIVDQTNLLNLLKQQNSDIQDKCDKLEKNVG